MDERAAPPVPADCDLRGMPFMPVDLVRLFDSDLYALSTGDEFKAAMTLWGKAFLQVPAGSLPKEDRILAHLSGAGGKWPKVRAMAMRGWVEATDGRLYHPVVVEKAREAWSARQAQRARTEAAREAKAATRRSQMLDVTASATAHVTTPVATSVTEYATGSKGQGQGQGQYSSPSAPVPDDGDDGKVIKFIRSLGGYLTYLGEDKRPDWLRDVHGLTLEQIRETFDWARQRGKVVVLPGQGPGYFGGFRTAMQEASRKAAAAERVRMEADALAERERLELSGLNERASKAEAATRARCGGFLAAYDEDPARWLSAMTGDQCDQIKAIRTAYNARRPLGLLVRHLEGMPRDLVEAGTARGREMHEQTEGATA